MSTWNYILSAYGVTFFILTIMAIATYKKSRNND